MLKSVNFKSFHFILCCAFIVRLIAVIFSQGYGMHDDHFLVVEAASSWADGYDYNNWLPWSTENKGLPEGHSFTYVGLNFLYFYLMKLIGIVNPKVLMLFNRLLHAFASLFVVWYGMKITEKLSTRENAVSVGWLLALLWIMPFLSVRNLVEVSATPFLVVGLWMLLKDNAVKNIFFAGLLIGVSVSFRYQIGVFAVGIAAYYLFAKQVKAMFVFSLGIATVFCLTQGIVDFIIWGYPFAEFWGYVTYNLHEGTAYLPNHNYFMYFYVLMGVFFVPLGILMCIGFFKSFRDYKLLFVPTFLFILFHTFYPNRQERFILTILPCFIILGVMGYQSLKASHFKIKLWRISKNVFWAINVPFLLFTTTMYSKKSRVEAMYSLYGSGFKTQRILLEGSASSRVSMLPKFYASDWTCIFTERLDSLQDLKVTPNSRYDYIFFFDEKGLNKRLNQYQTIYPMMTLVKKCQPSSLDILLRKLNPRNANEYIEVWKTNSSH